MAGKQKRKQLNPRSVKSVEILKSQCKSSSGHKAKISHHKKMNIKVEKEILYQTSTFEEQGSRDPSPSPTLVRRSTRIPKPSVILYTSLQDETIRVFGKKLVKKTGNHFSKAPKRLGKLERQILSPRSRENDKFQDIYDSIPKLRCVSPPRFTTKGINKKKIDCETLGVKKVGKALGNPYSNFHTRKSGIVFGNQTMDSDEKKEKYNVLAASVKNVLKSQSSVRLSSYVQPDQLKKVREEYNLSKVVKEDIDIRNPDDGSSQKTSRKESTKAAKHLGRKPGRTVLECEECGYKTTHGGHMKIHIICVHKDIKMLSCKYHGCEYQCTRKSSMTRHEKCVHRKDQLFKCQQCDFQTSWSVSLERHIITKHEKLKPWTCKICKQSFGQKFTLTKHVESCPPAEIQ